MSDTDDSKPDIRSQSHQAAKTVCTLRKAEVSDNSMSNRGSTKSYAQVATLVRPPVVRPKSGGLKPKRKRPYRLMGRYSKEERDSIIVRARECCLSVNEFIRASTLDTRHIPPMNPELRKRFMALNKELCRHGADLSRIADQLETSAYSPNEANTMLGMIGWSLIEAHRKVREALVWGMEIPDE